MLRCMVRVLCTARPPFRTYSPTVTVLAVESKQGKLSSDGVLLPQDHTSSLQKLQSKDWQMQTQKGLVPLPPFNATLKSTPRIKASVALAEAFVENGAQVNSNTASFMPLKGLL